MEVVEALADLPALEREWAPRIAEFNAHYNRLADGRAAERVVAEFFAPLLGAIRAPRGCRRVDGRCRPSGYRPRP